jgi:transcriptional regulator with XRE-family HTH domain
MEHDDFDSDAMFLGRVLRRARVAAGITSQDELARRLGFERTVIAKAESGRRPPSQEVAAAYAREFPQLNALIEGGLIEEWAEHVKKNGGSSFPEFFVDWIDAEKNASTLFYWAPTLVPGLLQVESYARVILATEPDETDSLDVLLASIVQRSSGAVTDCAAAGFRARCLFAVCERARSVSRDARDAPAPTAPGLVLLSCRGMARAGQAGAGRAPSRCQQVRNACFHGQSGLIFRTRSRACRVSRAGMCQIR